jgi:hypothetical protein
MFGSVLCVVVAWWATPSYAQRKTEANVTQARSIRREVPSFGRVEVSTSPGNYPLLIDGQQAGATSPAVRALDLAPGKHTVVIIFPNGRRWTRELNVAAGRKQCITLNYKPRPACALTIGAPAQVGEGSLITFAAEVVDAGSSPLNYQWSVSPSSARIISGQGTSTITVDSTGAGGAQVAAVLNVADGARDPLCQCKQTAQKATSVVGTPPPIIGSRRFDEFPSLSFDDDKARLDNFAIELQNAPGAVGYVFVYGNRAARPGETTRLGARAADYLVNVRGIDAGRVKVINAGPGDRNAFELWVVPRGARPPSPGGE